jgi:voltage-gated potassium channel Kch
MAQPNSDPEYALIIRQFRAVAGVAALVILGGAIFYHLVEKLSWLNAVYFCVVTLATVGYGDITPKTDAGKVFTIFYILIGVGIIATFANLLIKRSALRHRRH